MKSTWEDAILVLRKWKDEDTLLSMVSVTGNLTLKLIGRIVNLSEAQVELLADDAKVNATVSLLGCELGYGDPREVPEVTAKYGGANYEAFISIRSHNGHTLLFEIRSTTASKIAAL